MNRNHVVILCAALGAMCAFGCTEADTDVEKLRALDAMYREYRESFPGVPEVTADKLAKAIVGKEKLVVVDVRKPWERAVSMVPGSVSAEAFEANMSKHGNTRVIVLCTAGLRSGIYAQELRSKNIDASNLAGGILAWAHAGGDLVDDTGATRKVHVYAQKWDLAPQGYESVW